MLLLTVSPASAAAHAQQTPCWKRLLTDSYDGTIDRIYPLPCYHQAIAHLPPPSLIYSNVKDQLLAAQQAAANGRLLTNSGPGTPAASPPAASNGAKSSGALSLPVPLLVLGALAILLLAAGGAGVLRQRSRRRGPDSQ